MRLVAEGPVPAPVDAQALNRVLRNLLDNALRYAPSGSEVVVCVAEDGGTGVIRVTDQGPGFPPEFVAEAFALSSRADVARGRQSGGAGLGLAVAKQLVESHGGAIWIEPSPGRAGAPGTHHRPAHPSWNGLGKALTGQMG